jgi:uncharacterized repeat protein (TIGR01451 family)
MSAKRRVLPIAWIVLGVGMACFSLFFSLQTGQARPASELHVCPSGCAYASVQAAVDAAHESDVIKVAAGVYTGVQARLAPAGYLGPGVITQVVYLNKTISLEGGYTTTNWTTSYPITQLTTLDAQGQGRVLFIAGDISPTIQGLRIIGGNANGLGGIDDYYGDTGGGAYVITATAAISSNWILSNTADRGGGLALIGSNALVTANSIGANGGGGLYVINAAATISDNVISANSGTSGAGLLLRSSDAVVVNNIIASNTAVGVGGGLWMVGSGATLYGNTITTNTSRTDGGGIYLESSHDVRLSHNIISFNTTPGMGGGIHILASLVMLDNNIIMSNTATDCGGGVYVANDPAVPVEQVSVQLEGNTITGNLAEYGGGGLAAEYNVRATLVNNIIADNRANNTGSGIWVSGASLQFVHTTVAHNIGGDGSGLAVIQGPWSSSTVALTNTILVSNTIGITVAGGNMATLEATLWGSSGWANETDWGGSGTIITGTRNIWGDPAFVNPAQGDYHIGSTSLARDAGINAGITRDIDGELRPMGWGYDLGADEYPGPGLGIVDQASAAVINRGETLTYTLVISNAGEGNVTGLVLTDTLDSWQQAISVTSSLSDCTVKDVNTVVCIPGTFVAGATTIVTLTTRVSPTASAGHALQNAVKVMANETTNNVQATTFVQDCHVHINNDPVDYTAVQPAVDAAKSGDLIKISGTCVGVSKHGSLYQQVYLDKGLTIRGGYSTTDWSFSDPVANPTVLDALGWGRVFYITGGISPTIEGLHIVGGSATGFTFNTGSGVYIANSAPLLSGNVIMSNTAIYGGGLYLSESNAVLKGNTILHNTATSTGGGVSISGGAPTLDGNTISYNASRTDAGGGLHVSSSNAALIDNTITANTANGNGGGVNVWGGDSKLIGNTFVSNMTNGGGGGLSLWAGSSTVRENTIISNSAVGGGGLWALRSSCEISANTIANNDAASGGGAFLGGPVQLTNNVFVGNEVHGSGTWYTEYGTGSALYIEGFSVWLRNTTIARNRGGAAVYVTEHGPWNELDPIEYGRVVMLNTILVSNTVGISVTSYNSVMLEATLWGAGPWANGTDWSGTGSVRTGLQNYHSDPGFRNPAGGDYDLRTGSAAIDVGINVGVKDDRAGRSRPQGAGYDLGAYEYYPPAGLALSHMSVFPLKAVAGAELAYTITLLSDGIYTPTATTLENPLPPVLTFIPGSFQATTGTFTSTSGLLRWAGAMSPETPVTLTYRATLNESIPVRNVVSVTNQSGDLVRLSTWVNAQYVYLPLVLRPVPVSLPLAPIVFTSDHDGCGRNIYTLNVNTFEQKRLTQYGVCGVYSESPSWSPDRTRITFSSYWCSNTWGVYAICIMNADGSGLVGLTQHGSDTSPAWSPDGRKIAFVSNRDGNREIYVMNADGSGQTRLTNDPAQDDMPAWSPDGKSIAFSSNRDGHYQLYLMRPDGSGQTRLTDNTADDLFPDWSPDGQRIAFDSNRDGNRNIYVMNVDGSGQTRLTDNTADDGDPSWSPDGQQIVFASQRSGNWELYMMDADGSHLTRLTFSWDTNWAPDW